jgi:hypothetical protein
MYIQGDLQSVFDALFDLGVIDPVLEEDWGQALEELPQYTKEVDRAIAVINMSEGDVFNMVSELGKFDERVLSFVAMEVAKEFADFHSREEIH